MPRIRFSLCFAVVALFSVLRESPCAEAPSFNDEVMPLLTRYGCNAGACHGKLAGQNGFRLSLRGYAPELDHETIAREARGRRINPAAPEHSLLLRKALGQMPHGGGKRFEADSPAARLLRDWLAQGSPGPAAEEPPLVGLELSPPWQQLAPGGTASLSVTALYADGRRRDVTWLTQFVSGDSATLEVSPAGEVTALRHGEAVVRASFRDQVEIARFTMPYETPVDPSWYTEHNNAVDEQVFEKLAALRIEPSPLCDDATFIRRAYLDVIGSLPTPEEVRRFTADTASDKRARLVDALLQRPEYVDYWSHWLGDLLQNRKERDHDVRGTKGVRSFHRWLRRQVAVNRSWREIARDVLTASGPTDEQPQVGYFVVTVGEQEAEKSEVADSVAQAFLGTRIGCARCHNHPLEKYTQDDYYHFVGFFSRVALDRRNPKEGPTELIIGTRHLLNLRRQLEKQQQQLAELQSSSSDSANEEQAKKIAEAENRIAELSKQIDDVQQSEVHVRQPRTGEMLPPQPLDRSRPELAPGSDPRQSLAQWMTDPSNEHFSGAMVNRLWKHFLGAGLVEPVDDLRATNPPSNSGLWEVLNREFVASDYDLKHLTRLIMTSRVYQLSAETRESNSLDTKFYSHFYARRLPAEVLLDAICEATGEPESFPGYPLGVRAIQIPDPSPDSYFLELFGRSERTTACACERQNDVTLPQLLHLQNGDGMLQKLRAPEGRLARLLAALESGGELNAALDELFLATVSRLPADDERRQVAELLQGAEPREALTDVFWALLNSQEFAFNH